MEGNEPILTADELRALGAFRADVTGAGPAVYGLFLHGDKARAGGGLRIEGDQDLGNRVIDNMAFTI